MRTSSRLRLWQWTEENRDSWDCCLEISGIVTETHTIHLLGIDCQLQWFLRCGMLRTAVKFAWMQINEKPVHASNSMCWVATGFHVSYPRRCTAFSCSPRTSSVLSWQSYHYDVLPRLVWLVCTTLLPEALLLNVITALVPLQSAHHRSLT